MSRSFIYARVSTTDQNTDNQIREIEAAGFAVDRRRIVTESISGSVAASERSSRGCSTGSNPATCSS